MPAGGRDRVGLRVRFRSREAELAAERGLRDAGSREVRTSSWSAATSSGLWVVNSKTKELSRARLSAARALCSAFLAREASEEPGAARRLPAPGTLGALGAETASSASARSSSRQASGHISLIEGATAGVWEAPVAAGLSGEGSASAQEVPAAGEKAGA
jgi:hypothetical protein